MRNEEHEGFDSLFRSAARSSNGCAHDLIERSEQRTLHFQRPHYDRDDLAKPLVAAIAHELWKLHGGNEVLNWLEAEILLQNALSADESFDDTADDAPAD